MAAVAATSLHVAEEALSLIEVDYEVLPPVLSSREAMKEGAPLLHEGLVTVPEATGAGGTSDDGVGGSNVGKRFQHRLGDIEKGFQEADVIVEREFSTEAVHQGYIEPHTATALWDMEGNITLWSSSQGHFAMREQTANLLGVPVSKVKAIPMEIGGGSAGRR